MNSYDVVTTAVHYIAFTNQFVIVICSCTISWHGVCCCLVMTGVLFNTQAWDRICISKLSAHSQTGVATHHIGVCLLLLFLFYLICVNNVNCPSGLNSKKQHPSILKNSTTPLMVSGLIRWHFHLVTTTWLAGYAVVVVLMLLFSKNDVTSQKFRDLGLLLPYLCFYVYLLTCILYQ